MNIIYNSKTGLFEIDTGNIFLEIDKQDAHKLATRLIELITQVNLEEYRKDFNFEGSSL